MTFYASSWIVLNRQAIQGGESLSADFKDAMSDLEALLVRGVKALHATRKSLSRACVCARLKDGDAAQLDKLAAKLRQMEQAVQEDAADGDEAVERALAVVKRLAGANEADPLVTCSTGIKAAFVTLKKKYCK